MRANIHREYREVLFHDTNADAFFVIGSTLQSHQTREYEGKTYPYVSLDISSASHPFYTGEQRTFRAFQTLTIISFFFKLYAL